MVVCLLGPLSVDGPDGLLSLGPVQRRLLALLAVRAGRVVTADQIAEALGLGSGGAVRTTVSRLRRLVGDVVTAVPPGYLLDPVCLDVGRFEDLVRRGSQAEPADRVSLLGEALALWRGAALVEFADEEWARGEAGRLDELHRLALEDRIEALLQADRSAAAVADARALVLDHPLRERAQVLHMTALVAQGRTAEALRASDAFRRHLREQAGLEPSSSLKQLEHRILDGDLAMGATTQTELGVRVGPSSNGSAKLTDAVAMSSPGNLPRRRSELIGREREIGQLAKYVVPGELVTLTGPGGVGKTRLALDASASAAGLFTDGAWLVELASATAPADVLKVVVRCLELTIPSNPVTAELIARVLGEQQRLIVLDNCEHVLDAARELVEKVMGRCPQVAVVVTSREALGCDGERRMCVPTLSVHPTDGLSDAERLFGERVAGASGADVSDDAGRAAIAAICVQLDGLPLALELAAARVAALGLDAVSARIADGRDALCRRGPNQRHHSLASVVSWSYDLLSLEEQRVFERLAVFPDGFDLGGAEAVCGWAPLVEPVEDHLASLIDKSLVTVQRSTPTRYRLLEVVRQHAESRLSARAEAYQAADRLVAHYVEWTACADAGIRGPDELHWHRRFEAEWNNLRLAVSRAVATGNIDAACHIVWRTRWWACERLELEFGDWADSVLAMPGAATHPLIPIVGAAAAATALVRSEWAKGAHLLREATEREQALGDAPEPWVAQTAVWPESTALHAESLPAAAEILRRSGGSPFWEAVALWADALMPAVLLGNSPATETPNEDRWRRVCHCVEAAEELGNPTCTARAFDLLGCALRQVAPAEAVVVFERAIAMAQAVGNISVEAENRFDLALAYAALGRPHDVIAMQREAIRLYVGRGAWHLAGIMAIGTFRALVPLGEHRVACLIVGSVRRQHMQPAWYEHHVPARLEAQLEAELGVVEMARLVEEGLQLSSSALVAEVVDVLDGMSMHSDEPEVP